MKMYDITSDLLAAEKLIQEAVDENGEPRELTEEEMNFINDCFQCSAEQFADKFDGYCKFIKNYKLEAMDLDAIRKNYKSEIDRLARRSKTAENTAERLQSLLKMNMERIGLTKWKTEMFSAGIQSTQMNVKQKEGATLENVPECYLKPRELDTTAIKNDIKNGKLKVVETDGLDFGSVLFAESGAKIDGLYARRGSALVIR